MSKKPRIELWGKEIESVMTDIARAATTCDVKLLDPGILERVLQNDESVCGRSEPSAFKKLRELVFTGFIVRGKTFDDLGPEDAQKLITTVRGGLKERFGDQLGG